MPQNSGEQLRFDGRAAVVTGAGRGMGRAHACLLAARGAGVIVNDVDAQAADAVVADIRTSGGAAASSFDNIASEDGASDLIRRAVTTFGRLDIIVNNAGIMRPLPFGRLSTADFERTMRVNAYGPFYILRAAWPYFVEQNYGRVVNVSSIAALIGIRERVDYAASKAALIGLTRSLAAECSETDIRVNALAPSAVTQMSSAGARARQARAMGLSEDADLDRLMQLSAELVAPVVAWLAHEFCTINGEIVETGAGHLGRLLVASNAGFNDPCLSLETVRNRFAEVMADQAAAIYPPLRV